MRTPIFAALLLLSRPVHAAGVVPWWHEETFSPGIVIPDNHPGGVADTRWISTPGATQIVSVQVSLRIQGGWNGDFFAYLRHGDGFAVLLNRPGRSAESPYGSASSGVQIAFQDGAPADVHLSQIGRAHV